MCISPNFVWVERGPKLEQQPVACRQCWRCKRNRVEDYVGRCLAEASVSPHTCAITLTYAPRDDLADRVPVPRHFQLFMKLLRKAGHKVRYFVVAEYGDLKGRVHFHAILFFTHIEPSRGVVPRYKDDYPLGVTQDDAPFCREIPSKRMVHIREWPHGHIECDWSADARAVRYVCKYLTREDKQNGWFSLSKKPALGAEFFAKRAAMARDLDVLPHSFEYLPPGAKKDGKYLMTGATRRDYLAAVIGDRPDFPPDLHGYGDPALRARMSEWVRATYEKYERLKLMDNIEAMPFDEFFAEMLDERKREELRVEMEFSLARSSDNVDNEFWADHGYSLRGDDDVETWHQKTVEAGRRVIRARYSLDEDE